MSKIFIIAARSNQAVPEKKIKCFFNEQKWNEAVSACYKRNLAYLAIGCEIQKDDVIKLVPTEWHGRYQHPYPLQKLEQQLVDVAKWKFGRDATFNSTEAYEQAQLFGDL